MRVNSNLIVIYGKAFAITPVTATQQLHKGGFMKASQKFLTLSLAVLAVGFLTSCANKKSSDTTQSANVVLDATTSKTLASCSHATDSNFSLNISTVLNNSGQIDANWIKVKFQYLNANLTQTGYTLRFFKWRVIGGAAQLDSAPLSVTTYNISTGQTSSGAATGVLANSVTLNSGFYIQLNDDMNNPYQVLKVVAYKSDGSVLAQTDLLIPQFLASPADYKYNADGSARVTNLQQLHPLYGTDTSAWSQSQLASQFQQYCF
jgi:hypothetical protein